MRIEKVMNNNIVFSTNKEGIEVLVMGCGLGFKKNPGDKIDEEAIEKVFKLESESFTNQLIELLSRVPQEHITVANIIVNHAKENLTHTLNDNIYVSLTDHLSYAIERHHKGINLKNQLLWEIKLYHKKEYEIGLDALSIIFEQLGVLLPEDEAGYIALHLIGATMERSDVAQVADAIKIVQDVLQIVKYHFHREFNRESLDYNRLLTHLKFFAQRVLQNEVIEDEENAVFEMIKEQYNEAYKCALKVQGYIKRNYLRELSKTELTYLTVHIQRVTK